MGIPTIGGEVFFEDCYSLNPLVNAFALGIAPADRIFRARAEAPGSPIWCVGSKTGRDGIHGASMASAAFDEEAEAKRPTVAGRRPFPREAAHGGVPRTHAGGRADRGPGHGGRRAHLLHLGGGVPGRRRSGDRPRPRCPARDRHERLRDHALGVPGAHAPRGAERTRGGGDPDLRQVGPRRRSHRKGERRRPVAGPASGAPRRRSALPGADRRRAGIRSPGRAAVVVALPRNRSRRPDGTHRLERRDPGAGRIPGAREPPFRVRAVRPHGAQRHGRSVPAETPAWSGSRARNSGSP